MHIKQVVVEGFKTYREQTAVDFQPHLNCIGASRGVSLPRDAPRYAPRVPRAISWAPRVFQTARVSDLAPVDVRDPHPPRV
jgi:hypothetical protein